MAVDMAKVRMAVEAAVRQGLVDVGINASGQEVKTFVDHHLSVLQKLMDGEFNAIEPAIVKEAEVIVPAKV
jgi:hypothetical protein